MLKTRMIWRWLEKRGSSSGGLSRTNLLMSWTVMALTWTKTAGSTSARPKTKMWNHTKRWRRIKRGISKNKSSRYKTNMGPKLISAGPAAASAILLTIKRANREKYLNSNKTQLNKIKKKKRRKSKRNKFKKLLLKRNLINWATRASLWCRKRLMSLRKILRNLRKFRKIRVNLGKKARQESL